MIGTTEIIIIAGVVLVLFGASALPKFAKSLGRARSEFEKGSREALQKRDEDETDSDPQDNDATDA